MGHRGNRSRCPENTLTAFRQAFADGADIVETDIRLTRDGHMVCIHDARVDRTTNGVGLVNDFSLSELRELSASGQKPGFPAEPVPTLPELFTCLPADRAFALELKDAAFRRREVCERLLAAILGAGLSGRVMLLSFSPLLLRWFPQHSTEVPLGLISFKRFWPDRRFQLQGPVWPILVANPWYALATRACGQMLCPLDQHPDSRLGFYLKIGCDAILTDDPGATVSRLIAMGVRTRGGRS
jgi:glycerophosphoryl diester phosphodiesterase